ncbi:hypothetical protein JCM10450v2_006050 [Rhodotorula kratochvilovae]
MLDSGPGQRGWLGELPELRPPVVWVADICADLEGAQDQVRYLPAVAPGNYVDDAMWGHWLVHFDTLLPFPPLGP